MTKKVFEDATMKDGKLYFDKRAAADVSVDDGEHGDYFTFTPGFGDCKDFDDLEDYLIHYVEENNLEWARFGIDWMRHCVYKINPETLELGEFVEGSGIDYDTMEWDGESLEYVEDEEEEE